MKIMMKLLLLISVVSLSGCNTWQAIKDDTSDAGETIGKAAQKTGEMIKEALK